MAKLDFWMTLRKQAILLDLPHICTRHTPISTLQKTHPKNEYVYIYIRFRSSTKPDFPGSICQAHLATRRRTTFFQRRRDRRRFPTWLTTGHQEIPWCHILFDSKMIHRVIRNILSISKYKIGFKNIYRYI